MRNIKDNLPLALGVGLPLALVAIFGLASWVPQLLVDLPQYDVLYVTDYSNNMQCNVITGRLACEFSGQPSRYMQLPKLFRFSPATGGVREVAIPMPPEMKSDDGPDDQTQGRRNHEIRHVPLTIPDMEAVTVDNSTVAPDGYAFRPGGWSGGGGLMTEIFIGGGRYNNVAALTKNGRVIRIPNADGQSYYYGNVKFIGWVVAKP
jgi:hypothetical protein